MAGGGGRSKAEASLANLTQRGILGAGSGPRAGPGRSPAPGPRHCWVDDPPGFAGRWPGVVVEWRRGHSGWQGRTLVVVVLGGDEPLVLELWLDARHLTAA